MKVLKFGGTSVGSPQRMKELWSIITSQEADKSLIVLSAVAGTTNELVAITEKYYEGDKAAAFIQIDALYEKYFEFVQELLETDLLKQKAIEVLQEHFILLKSFANDLFTNVEERIVLAQGELISTFLFHIYLEERQIPTVVLPALRFMRINEDQEPDMKYAKIHLKELLENHPNTAVFITQGYICRNTFGEVDNLRRGGSDYTASILGAVLQAEEIQIWTDIDGFHNNDPRHVNHTKPIKHLSFDEAAELAYFGAKILHPQSVYPAKRFNVPVRLLDTLKPEFSGTLISDKSDSQGQIVAIAAKDGITAIRIQSSRMLLAYGFLRRVFEVFERYKTPIDMITTSEVAVSLTVDTAIHLEKIVEELAYYGQVEVDQNQSIVCVVGDFSTNTHGHATIVSEALKHIPIRMISYGGSEHNISMLIPEKYKVEALRSLHYRLF